MAMLTVGRWLVWGREGRLLFKGWFGALGEATGSPGKGIFLRQGKKMPLTCHTRLTILEGRKVASDLGNSSP